MHKRLNNPKLIRLYRIFLALAPLALIAWFGVMCYVYYDAILRWGSGRAVNIASVLISVIFFLAGLLIGLQLKRHALTRGIAIGAIAMIVATSISIAMSLIVPTYAKSLPEYYTVVSLYIGVMLVLFGAMIIAIYIAMAIQLKQKFRTLVAVATLIVMLLSMCSSALALYQAHPYSSAYKVYRALHPFDGYDTLNANVKYSFAHASQKLSTRDDMPDYQQLDIKLAQNEWEGLQLVLASQADESVSISITPFSNASGETLYTAIYKEHYLDLPLPDRSFRYSYPDGLIPITEGTSIELTKDELQTFYIETHSTVATTPGDYSATLAIRDDSGVILTTSIQAEVWDFALPEAHYCKTAVGLDTRSSLHELGIPTPTFYEDNPYNMVLGYGYNTWEFFYDGTIDLSQYPQVEKMYKDYYDYVLEHGMSANFLPYDLLDTRTDEEGVLLVDRYLDDPRVTSFCIPYPREDDAKLVAYYQKATAKPEWAKKAYFYPVDEPGSMARKNAYQDIVARLDRLLGEGNYNMITPFYEITSYAWDTGEKIEVFELQKEYNSWICPQTYFYWDKSFAQEMDAHVQNGGESWWYVCNGPKEEDGYCNLFVQQDAIKHRILFWQQYDYDVQGFLYYFVNVWTERGTQNPWNRNDLIATALSGYGLSPSGDGTLIFPGVDVGTPGVPAGTLRLKNVTAGIEDYDYLKLAEAKLGRQEVDKIVDRVTTSLTRYTSDYDLLEAVRREIGEALSA